MGIMEKKMETTKLYRGLYRVVLAVETDVSAWP